MKVSGTQASAWIVSLCLGLACAPAPPSGDDEPRFLRVGIPTEPQTFNPLLVRDLVTAEISRQLHASLVRVNLETQRVEPMLAERWEVDDERTAMTMWLRSGAFFSDGEPFSARDVAFTMKLLHSGAIPSQFASNLQVQGEPIRVEVVDDLVVRFHLPSPVARPERLFTDIGILPSHVLEPLVGSSDVASSMGPGSEPSAIVGLGPFRLESHVAGRNTTIVPNPHYWGLGEQPSRPRLAGVVFEVAADAQTNLLRLQAGELDVVERLSPDAFAALADEDLAEDVRDIGPGMTSERLWFNLNPRAPISESKKDWFSRLAFRRAVALTLDRDALARVVFQGHASPAGARCPRPMSSGSIRR